MNGEAEVTGKVPVTDKGEIIARIWEDLEITIGDNDPLLAMVTIHKIFLEDYDDLLKRHNEAISAVIGNTADQCAKSVIDTLKTLRDETLNADLKTTMAKVAEQARFADKAMDAMKNHQRSITILTAVNIVIFIAFIISSIIF